MDHTISQNSDAMTVYEYIRGELKLSRTSLIRLKQMENGIMQNGLPVTVRAVLHTGDVLSLKTEDGAGDVNENIVPSPLPVEIVYEDADCVVVNKRAGMPTHPSHGHFDDSLANALAYYYRNSETPFVFRAVNRLDNDTSGLVLVAKNRHSAFLFSGQQTDGTIKKSYKAVVCGKLETDSGQISSYIRRKDGSIILREAVTDKTPDADYALTEYTCDFKNEFYSIADVTPRTGRTHQIRVHFASIGYPLVGDYLYGKRETIILRHALHAYKLSFRRIADGSDLSLNTKLPQDMINLIKELDLRYEV